MQEETTTVDPKYLDFQFLREEGIKYLEKFTGGTWTDYNTHDPGITILEHLCFALVDLHYRTSFPMQDILAGENPTDNSTDQLFGAREILPCNPVTINDFRKLIIDCEGVKNAMIVPETKPEPHIYIDRSNNRLHHIPPDTSLGVNEHVLPLKGLYKVLLELEYDESLGDLNANKVVAHFREEQFQIEFPHWDDPAVNWENNESIFQHLKSLKIIHPDYTQTFKYGEQLPENVKSNLLSHTEGEYSILEQYTRRVQKALQIRQEVKEHLHHHRNLGEDFVSIEAVKVEDVALVADIEIDGDVDMEEVLQEIYFQINDYLAPQVRFHQVEELWEQGLLAEEIFEGVPLRHGFLLTEDLPKSRELVHLSDMVNILMDIPGIKTIKSFNAASFPQGVLMRGGQRWCIKLNPESNYVPRLSPWLSDITFYKDGFSIQPDIDTAVKKFEHKNASHEKWKPVSEGKLNFSIPRGKFRNLSQYFSIQNDFTHNYGISQEGLPGTATRIRKLQAKHLKAYLLFFEQLIANYQAQLSNIKQLFSPDNNTSQTYFYQLLDNVPGIEDLYDTEAVVQALQTLEPESTFSHRKNRFLDHLLARLGLNVLEYTMLTSGLDEEKKANRKIEDKVNLIKNYPELSAERMRGFNYLLKNEIWNTRNVSGLKKRICQLMGIENPERRSLAILDEDQANEGFHLIEHITLRPKVSEDKEGNPLYHQYLKAFTDSRCQDGPWEEDPYSSIVSFVLPNWIGRFPTTKFRVYFEKIAHLESPTHMAIQFHWVGPDTMAAFETAYRNWLSLNATDDTDPLVLTEALNELTSKLNGFQQKEEFEIPPTSTPEIPEPLNELWKIHDFGKAVSYWIYGEGNILHQTKYTGNCKRVNPGEGTIALYQEKLTDKSEAVEVTFTMDHDEYSEAGLAFFWESPDDYWLLYCRAFHRKVVVAHVKKGEVQKVLENTVKDIRGKQITLRVNTFKGQIKCLQSSPNTIGSEFIINVPGNFSDTHYGLFTRYSNNTRFTGLETITGDAVNRVLPLPGLGNLFIRPEDDDPTPPREPVFYVK